MRTTSTRRGNSNTRKNWGTNMKNYTNRGTSNCCSGYSNLYSTCSQKIQSWKTIYNQTRGPAKYPRPTPTQLNTFANWVNKGAVVHNVTPSIVNKWARQTNCNFNKTSPTSCKNVLSAKFGKNTIKAVCRTKTGSFMVACAPTYKGKPFCFPK